MKFKYHSHMPAGFRSNVWTWNDYADVQDAIDHIVILCSETKRTYELVQDSPERHFDIFIVIGSAIVVDDHFAESQTEYTVQTTVTPVKVTSTAELSPFLRVAEELEKEFGHKRDKLIEGSLNTPTAQAMLDKTYTKEEQAEFNSKIRAEMKNLSKISSNP